MSIFNVLWGSTVKLVAEWDSVGTICEVECRDTNCSNVLVVNSKSDVGDVDSTLICEIVWLNVNWTVLMEDNKSFTVFDIVNVVGTLLSTVEEKSLNVDVTGILLSPIGCWHVVPLSPVAQ